MRRADREILDMEEVLRMIEAMDTIRIAFPLEDGAYIVPLSFGFKDEEGQSVFYMHSAKEGRKIDLIGDGTAVGFELDRSEGLVRGDKACSFSMRYSSIIGRGRIRICSDDEKSEGMQAVMKHYTGRDDWDIPSRELSHAAILRLDVSEMSAKRH